MMSGERSIRVTGADDLADATAFIARAVRADDAAVVRCHRRDDGRFSLWTHTGFDVLATRSVFGAITPADIVCDAGSLLTALQSADAGVAVDPGFSLDSAWRGALPAPEGYAHLDDVPARSVIALARDGAEVARTQGSAHGPATGLLDQDVLEVSGTGPDGSAATAAISMRSVFALTAMGFVRDTAGQEITETSPLNRIAADEPVRVRISRAWIRIDARYGSVYQRRVRDLSVTPR